tara:strand:- start:347 stop:502 length:156 start_codon:yes stop_codon:yes gene_type:complete
MQDQEIQGNDEDQLIELIGLYGEAYLIKYLTESILDKQQIIINNVFNLKND